ncbi:hypothetical protein AALP_AA6G301400 [Arabis alpina]|uniref:Mei2-like C-terminal RNA recognition motif domain-containing protein n=1 Tax=Arabis alpina TaxID=50452 RepID=A0A087GSP0_ARAAL|nr:hypothetical protein AALP_AA6G301400 [Arabis alpina]
MAAYHKPLNPNAPEFIPTSLLQLSRQFQHPHPHSHFGFCSRRCLPPRLLKKKENRSFYRRKPLPVEDKVKTYLAGKTSVMIRNIPNDFGRSDLLRILDKHCWKVNKEAAAYGYYNDQEQNPSSYDFFYLPMDFVKRANLGYAFVNFTSSIAAVRFHREFDHFFWAYPKTNKTCRITVAKFQGKEELTQHFKESKFPCHTNEYLPVVLSPPSDGFTGYSLKTIGYRVGFRGGASGRA